MKTRQVLGHLLFWCIIMLTYAVSEWGYRNNFLEAIIFELLFLPVRLVAVYVNWFIFIPKFLYKNQILKYFLLITVLLFLLATIQRFITLYWGYPKFFPTWNYALDPFIFFRIVQNLVIIVSPVAFSMGIKIFLDWYDQKNQTKQLTIEKREAELKYLKAQINPHFLFNTLNNLYGLSLEQSKKVPELILKLSDLLSYSLYESAVEKTSVYKEIKLINDFIAIEKERFEGRIHVEWKIQKSFNMNLRIAPLVLMPLVENAFKHGVNEKIDRTNISMSLKLENKMIIFETCNTLPDTVVDGTKKGIGLENLRRRLDLLYPNAHSLKNHIQNDQYVAIVALKYIN